MTVVAAILGSVDAAQLGPGDELGYRRPPVTVSFEDLRRRGLRCCSSIPFSPRASPSAMLSKPHNGNRYASARQGIYRVLIAPEQDGTRTCTAVLWHAGHQPEGDEWVTFTISARPGPASPACVDAGSPADPADPADMAAALGLTLTRLADQARPRRGCCGCWRFLPPNPCRWACCSPGSRMSACRPRWTTWSPGSRPAAGHAAAACSASLARLFPGRWPGRPLTEDALAQRLHALGISPR